MSDSVGTTKSSGTLVAEYFGTSPGILENLPPCGTPMIFDALTPPERRDYSCVALPNQHVPSQKAETVSFFINGVFNSESESARSAELLAEKLGRLVVRVHNNSEQWRLPIIFGFTTREYRLPVPDFLHAATAKIAPALSGRVEPSVQFLRAHIARVLKRDGGATVDIHAHSQGGIIVRGALRDLRQREFASLSADEWRELSNRIHVTTYGSAEHNLATPAREFAHTYDVVPLGTSIIDWVRRFVSDRREPPLRQEVASISHAFEDYLANLPTFLSQELLSEPYDNPAKLTERLRCFVASGDYSAEVSNQVYQAVLRKLSLAAERDT